MAEMLSRQPLGSRAWGMRAESVNFGAHSRRPRISAAVGICFVAGGVVAALFVLRTLRVSAELELSERMQVAPLAAAQVSRTVPPEARHWGQEYIFGNFVRGESAALVSLPENGECSLETGSLPALAEVPDGAAAEADPRVKEIDVVYASVTDPSERLALAAEMASVDDPLAVRQLLVWIKMEPESSRRRDLLYALAGAEARFSAQAEVEHSLSELYRSAGDLEEKEAIEEVLMACGGAAAEGEK